MSSSLKITQLHAPGIVAARADNGAEIMPNTIKNEAAIAGKVLAAEGKEEMIAFCCVDLLLPPLWPPRAEFDDDDNALDDADRIFTEQNHRIFYIREKFIFLLFSEGFSVQSCLR